MSETNIPIEDKLYNYLCEIGAIAIDTEIHEIRLIVYEELGLSGIDKPREWVEGMKIHKDITGFQTPAELTAYEKGRNDEEKVMVKFIGDWQPNETNSVLGQLLVDKITKLQAELKQHKETEEIKDLNAEIERLKSKLNAQNALHELQVNELVKQLEKK